MAIYDDWDLFFRTDSYLLLGEATHITNNEITEFRVKIKALSIISIKASTICILDHPCQILISECIFENCEGSDDKSICHIESDRRDTEIVMAKTCAYQCFLQEEKVSYSGHLSTFRFPERYRNRNWVIECSLLLCGVFGSVCRGSTRQGYGSLIYKQNNESYTSSNILVGPFFYGNGTISTSIVANNNATEGVFLCFDGSGAGNVNAFILSKNRAIKDDSDIIYIMTSVTFYDCIFEGNDGGRDFVSSDGTAYFVNCACSNNKSYPMKNVHVLREGAKFSLELPLLSRGKCEAEHFHRVQLTRKRAQKPISILIPLGFFLVH